MHANNLLTCSPTSCEQKQTLYGLYYDNISPSMLYFLACSPHYVVYYSGTFHMHVTHYHMLYFRPHSSLYIMLQTPHIISRCMVPTLLPLHDSLGNVHGSIMGNKWGTCQEI